MQIVPVIDIRNGVVVRAVAGERDNYLPLATPLAETAAPLDVVEGLVAHFDCRSLYVADLDAIEGRGSNAATVEALASAHPKLRLWFDAGLRDADDVARLLARQNADAVIGSECFATTSALAVFRDEPRVILSLDFRGDDFLGAPQLLEQDGLWPSRVIVMTLSRVGLGEGPDFTRLAEIIARADGREVYAAGGVRGPSDLARLEDMGVAGALVASALHNGALTRADIAAITK